MNKTKVSCPTNFIRQIIEKDLAIGKYKNIRTRFPPEPSGYLHIGHAKSICLNFDIAQDYNGKCNLRFDDTNPAQENIEYIESIKNDIRWLGFRWSGDTLYSSNYFNQIYKCALKLIDKGLAYVDELSPKEIHQYRGALNAPGRNSPYRDRSIKENLILFEKMRNGGFEEGKACLRAKIDMSSSFIAMRDPVLYRIKFVKHHQTGNTWCIYPMYDFAHCISDVQEEITHSLCTMEFQVNRCLYNWILDNIDISIQRPCQYEFSRLNLEYTVISKRKLKLLVNGKYVDGWDDPRMPTIAGLRRRGYTAASIRKFCKRIGVTKQNSIIEMSLLESCIREDLNDNAPRLMAVIDPIKLIIENYAHDSSENIIMHNHPNKLEMGSRKVPFGREIWIEREDFSEHPNKHYKRLALGREVRLRNSYVVKATRIDKDEHGNVITIYCTYNADTLGKDIINNKPMSVIHWVSIVHALPIEIRFYQHLFNVPDPDARKDFLATINSKSLLIKQGYAEPSVQEAKIGKAYQFERKGYFCLDDHFANKSKLVFNCTVNLRDTWMK